MSDQIIEGKRRKFLAENPVLGDFDMSRDEILEQEFSKIKDMTKQQEIVQMFNGEHLKSFHIKTICFLSFWIHPLMVDIDLVLS